MAREKAELGQQKLKASLERGILATEDKNRENTHTIEQLRDRIDKLLHELQEQGHQAKRSLA